MGERITTRMKCPYCDYAQEIYFAESSGFTSQKGEACSLIFDIVQELIPIKRNPCELKKTIEDEKKEETE